MLAAGLMAACGGGDGPAIEARTQSLQFVTLPAALTLPATGLVAANASSGLPVVYGSDTPSVCTVEASTGVVTGVAVGTCQVTVNQAGDSRYAPAPGLRQALMVKPDPVQSILFSDAPALSFGGTATVAATASSGLPVVFGSLSPGLCSVVPATGLVTSLGAGTCVVTADQPGDADHHAAPQVALGLVVAAPPPVFGLPGMPASVSASAGATPDQVVVRVGSADDGGTPITGYQVTSTPPGVQASGPGPALTVICPGPCAGRAFSVAAVNAVGAGPASAAVDVITGYDVVARFLEPDTQPRDSIFIGSFRFNATTGTVSGLRGILSESMTGSPIAYPGDNMVWLPLKHQLSSLRDDVLGGLLVTTFMLPTTDTLATMGGGDGWSPGTGFGLYFGFPLAANPSAGGVGNAYARIFVNTQDPTAPLTPAQRDKLAYADCAAGGMMGATCMTGTAVAGYGVIGTMSGYPVSQIVTRQP